MELAVWSLEQIYNHLKKYSGDIVNKVKYKTHDDELWVGWIIGKFLESKFNTDCYIGLPLKGKKEIITIEDLETIKLIDEDVNFDIIIIQADAMLNGKIIDYKKTFRIQIKRYKRNNPNTIDCISFIRKKLNHYEPDRNLNFAFLLESGFKLDVSIFTEFTTVFKFKFASVWFVGYHLNQKFDPFLIPIFPKFTGEIWRPSK